MNVREYMHEICSQNANTLMSTEEGMEGKRKMSKEEALIEQQNKNKVCAVFVCNDASSSDSLKTKPINFELLFEAYKINQLFLIVFFGKVSIC